jgi:transposase
MANQLKMATIQAMPVVRERGRSFRRIARELGVHRETVRRYVGMAEAGWGTLPGEVQNRPNPPAGSTGPPSRCEPFRQVR